MVSAPVLRISDVVAAIVAFAVLLAAGWAVPFYSSGVREFVLQPVDLPSSASTSLRLTTFASYNRPRIAVLGDSIALGQVMSAHNISGWQEKELSSAIGKAIEERGVRANVFNFAANGQRPADMAKILDALLQRGVDAVVVIVNLRGFSVDFEPPDQQHLAPWYDDLTSPSWLDRFPLRGLADLFVHQVFGAPPQQWLSRARARMNDGGAVSPEASAIQALRLRQRLSSVLVNPDERVQAKVLAQALQKANLAGVPVVVVYATENPKDARRMMPPPAFQRHRAALEQMVAKSGKRHTYLGPDDELKEQHFIDEMHLTPEGYALMAKRIAPVVVGSLRPN